MEQSISLIFAEYIISNKPTASAKIKGSNKFPMLKGIVNFYPLRDKTLVTAEIEGLPSITGECENTIYGFHIHEGNSCTGNDSDPFADAKSHFNKFGCTHPSHSGDLPPIFGTPDNGWMAFLTNRFKVNEIIDKTIIIHSKPDDFHTDPSGNSGTKIACGVIKQL